MERFAPEDKFVADALRKDEALALLSHFCLPDPAFQCGFVNSVYYDTPWLDAFWEKANGDFLKSKLRLRWYEPDVSTEPGKCTAFLEVKRKIGSGRRKVRSKMLLDQAWIENAPLTDHEFMDVVGNREKDLGEWLPVGYTPAVAIKYERNRYVCPVTGARVALDTGIHVTRVNQNLIPQRGCGSLSCIVLEIKGEERVEVPWMKHMVSIGFRSCSFSKFGMCLSKIIQEE